MFKRMGDLIQDQDLQITRIDADVQETDESMQRAEEDLMKYLTNISSNRGLILKVFCIVMAFIVFFIVFLS